MLENFLFNGEKNFRSLGIPLAYDIDYYGMANRAWNLYLTTDITKIIIDRLTQFTIGDGLKLQYEPDKLLLKKKYNIEVDHELVKLVESMWSVYSNSKHVSNNSQNDIHGIATQVMINTLLCGDCLIIRRIKNGIVKLQVIDGRNVTGGTIENNSNNTIIDGVEINKNGEHVAYHILTENNTNNKVTNNIRIRAKDSKGNSQAWLVYANNSRISQVRGVSAICSIIQKLDQLSSYAENEVIASEVNSKLATVIEHTEQSDGINPLVGRSLLRGININKGNNAGNVNNGSSNNTNNNEIDNTTRENILKLTNGLLINLPTGKSMKSFDTKRPNINFQMFLDTNAKYIFASQSIPYEVALMLFSNNFSASRGALKMFELTLKVMRKNIVIDGVYKPTFKTFFLLENLKNNISVNNFDKLRQNEIDVNALNRCRFISPPIPHVDPLKEVNAVVEKINNNLSTREEGMEELGSSTDFDNTIERIANENKLMEELGIVNKIDESNDKNNNKNVDNEEKNNKTDEKNKKKEKKNNNKEEKEADDSEAKECYLFY
jgi:lambda family phage portal protein